MRRGRAECGSRDAHRVEDGGVTGPGNAGAAKLLGPLQEEAGEGLVAVKGSIVSSDPLLP